MIVGVPKEVKAQENRVGLVPAGARTLVEAGAKVLVEKGAGEGSGINDQAYVDVGAKIIPTADDPAKLEIRMMLLWEKNAPRPYLVNNLVRLSKGAMVGVRYNKNKTWVGGSVGFCNPS